MIAMVAVAAAGFLVWAGSQWRIAHREHLTQPVGHRHDHRTVPGRRLARCTCGDTVSLWRAL